MSWIALKLPSFFCSCRFNLVLNSSDYRRTGDAHFLTMCLLYGFYFYTARKYLCIKLFTHVKSSNCLQLNVYRTRNALQTRR